jgi:hypothetical protein
VTGSAGDERKARAGDPLHCFVHGWREVADKALGFVKRFV